MQLDSESPRAFVSCLTVSFRSSSLCRPMHFILTGPGVWVFVNLSSQLPRLAHKTPPSSFHCLKYSLPSIAVPDSVCSQFSATFSMRFATKGVNCAEKRHVSILLPLSTKIFLDLISYVEARQIGTHICAHFLVVDNVSSPLGVSAHGTGAVALVVVVAGLLGGERQAADGAEERGGGLHGGSSVRV